MSEYRRYYVDGAMVFFTLVTHQRRKFFEEERARKCLREALETVRKKRPFSVDAVVLLRDHLHMIWTLPRTTAISPCVGGECPRTALDYRKLVPNREEPMSLPFDATVKELLAPQPDDFVPAFGLPTTQPTVRLNIDLSTLSAATNVAIGFGEPLQEIANLNFQSGPDAEVGKRCHLYSAALNFRFGVPVRTVLILLRPKADAATISGSLSYASGASGVEFRYEVVRLWQQPVETFLRGGVSLLPLATLCQLPADRPLADALRDVVREIRRLAAECAHAQAARLMTAAYILTGLRIHRDQLGSIYDGVKVMHESSAYELIMEEGAIREAQGLLLRQGQKRINPPSAETVAALKAIKDLDRLHRLADAVLSASSWEDLLETP